MDIYQERKYDAVDGKIVNRATGKPIPDDEPLIIFRAKDKLAGLAMSYYAALCEDKLHHDVIRGRVHDFIGWQLDNPEKVREPDSDPSCLKP
jgi:hypothetical protein